MKLLKFEDYQVKVAEEALLIKPIRMLYHQDRSQKKEKFFQQMSYMFFMCSPQSTYAYILNEQERANEIILQEGLPKDFKPSPLLKEAMEIYKKHTVTVSQKLLDSALIAADKVSTFLKEVDLKAEDDKGKPKYQISSITAALKNMEGIVASLQNLQKKIDQEIEEQNNARGSQELTVLDNDMD